MAEARQEQGWPEMGPATGVAVDRVEVRLLGALRVRRADGSLVSPRDWRTGKTADLLRLLALSNGDVVPLDSLVDALWPDVEERKARASVRTATFHLRKAVGVGAVVRHGDGLRLAGTWVDTGAFSQLAGEVSRHHRKGRFAECVQVAREAQSLYVEDLRAHDDDSVWATDWRAQLAHEYVAMLTEAAEAAVELGWMRDAVDCAARVLERDPCSERACRALMLGYAGLGETDCALRAFERCRAVLAHELGADPAPQTAAVHLQVLRAEPAQLDTSLWVGRHAEVHWFGQVLDGATASGRSVVVQLNGDVGSGRRRLVQQAVHVSGVRAIFPAPGLPAAELLEQIGDRDTVVVVLESTEVAGRPDLLRAVLTAHAPVVLVVVDELADIGRGPSDTERPLPGDLEVDVLRLDVKPLTAAETEALAASVLRGAVTPQLGLQLAAVAQGNPGRALAALTDWVRTGRVTATAAGLVLAPSALTAVGEAPGADGLARPHASDAVLARIVEHLHEEEIEVLSLAALLDGPVSVGALAALLDGQEPMAGRQAIARSAVERLADLGVLVTGELGVALRDPVLRAAVESWLRPSVRRRLHVRIAEQARVSATERMRHWVAAGESELACAAAFDAARLAAAEGRWAEAHDRLQQVWRLVDPEASAADRCELHELLGDACRALGRREEARECYIAALGLAKTHELEALNGLSAKCDEVFGRIDAAAPLLAAAVTPGEARRDSSDWAAMLDAVESDLLPHREFDTARRTSLLVAERAGDPVLQARAALLLHLPDLLLGDPADAAEPLRRAAEEARVAGALEAARSLDRALRLVRHDEAAIGQHADLPLADSDVPDDWSWATLRVLVEVGDLTAAVALQPRLPMPEHRPLVRHLALLASAELSLATGDRPGAIGLLEQLLDEVMREGLPLLVPYVAARLVCLVAPDDADAAHDYFDLLDLAVGAFGDQPREQVWRQLARAAIRSAAGRPRAAAASAAIAAKVALDISVVPLAARAEARRATYLREAGALVESRLAASEAARLRARGRLASVDDGVVVPLPGLPATLGRARLAMA